MNDPKSSISHAQSYREIGEHWDEHDLSEVWEQTSLADFSVRGQAKISLYAVESGLSQKLQALAQRRGVSAETLVNMWLQEKVEQEAA